ncbi:NAD-dependent epimerase/dehydratase family protein [Candidatus Zixiibacteriota bacterium]
MKIFITGSTGFIGRHVVERLARTDHQMVCLIRETSDIGQVEKRGATLVRGDIVDKDSLLQGMRGCDWVIDIAGLYSFWEPDKRIFADVNITGTRNIMECALELGVAKVVHVSTAGIYGKPEESPFTEDSSVGPDRFCEYFRTKYEGDLIAWELHRKKGLPLVMVYPGAVLGPGDPKASGQYISNLIHRRLPATVFKDDGFTFVHVKDIAEIIVRALEKEDNIGERYLAGNHRMTWGQANQMISEISGVALPRLSLPGPLVMFNAAFLTLVANIIKKPPLWGMATDQMKVMRAGYIFDGSKAERELGITYTPIRVALEEAITSLREGS